MKPTRVLMFGVPAVVLACVFSIAGCSDDATGPDNTISIRPTSDAFRAGETVKVIIRNNTDAVLFKDECLVMMEKQSGASWQSTGGRVCFIAAPGDPTPESWSTIPPGGMVRDSIDTPPSRAKGTYRLRFRMRWIEGQELTAAQSSSANFRIE